MELRRLSWGEFQTFRGRKSSTVMAWRVIFRSLWLFSVCEIALCGNIVFASLCSDGSWHFQGLPLPHRKIYTKQTLLCIHNHVLFKYIKVQNEKMSINKQQNEEYISTPSCDVCFLDYIYQWWACIFKRAKNFGGLRARAAKCVI